MKRTSLAIIFACCMLALAAQDVIKVNYKGAKPTISDFAWSFLSDYVYDENEDDCLDEVRSSVKQAWALYRKGASLNEWEMLTVDNKNGYAVYEHNSEYESVKDLCKVEMCYWNEADGKHCLFAYNVGCYTNGKYSPGQFDGIQFYRYNKSTKKMAYCEVPGLGPSLMSEDGAYISYSLPRNGKDIIATYWYDNGTKKQKKLKWNGRKFSF
ncbi:MAG: hypothetical protein J5629_07385 [Muribaculaceae bacterium]|nr:hypothetical protein [Muribaculaceae bacterium]